VNSWFLAITADYPESGGQPIPKYLSLTPFSHAFICGHTQILGRGGMIYSHNRDRNCRYIAVQFSIAGFESKAVRTPITCGRRISRARENKGVSPGI